MSKCGKNVNSLQVKDVLPLHGSSFLSQTVHGLYHDMSCLLLYGTIHHKRPQHQYISYHRGGAIIAPPLQRTGMFLFIFKVVQLLHNLAGLSSVSCSRNVFGYLSSKSYFSRQMQYEKKTLRRNRMKQLSPIFLQNKLSQQN